MIDEEELLLRLALHRAPGIGDIRAKKLIRAFGSARSLFKDKKSRLTKVHGIGKKSIQAIFSADKIREAELELKYIKDNKISCLNFEDEDYPYLLKHCIDAPLVLFRKGNINLSNKYLISIVGTRKITRNGVDFCRKLIRELAVYNPVIVSGFAYGTDIEAQLSAVENNLQTIGCLAHGFDKIYPPAHRKYVEKIMDYGGFFTDFWSTDDFIRNNFLKRNRIIAGLTEATIVIESGEKGGSLVTADLANSYNREVFAVPGRPTDLMSEGCNSLIKNQQAHLLNRAEDIPQLLGWRADKRRAHIQPSLFIELDTDEQLVYDFLMENGKKMMDDIALGTGLQTNKLAFILLQLELKNCIRQESGKFFELI